MEQAHMVLADFVASQRKECGYAINYSAVKVLLTRLRTVNNHPDLHDAYYEDAVIRAALSELGRRGGKVKRAKRERSERVVVSKHDWSNLPLFRDMKGD